MQVSMWLLSRLLTLLAIAVLGPLATSVGGHESDLAHVLERDLERILSTMDDADFTVISDTVNELRAEAKKANCACFHHEASGPSGGAYLEISAVHRRRGSSSSSTTNSPTPSPTTACADKNEAVLSAIGYTCADASTAGYCSSFLCPTCTYAGYCDTSCGYCDPTPSPTDLPTVSPAPTVPPTSVPVPSPTPPPTTSCADRNEAVYEAVGYSCTEASAGGYCSSYLCPTCTYAGYCDTSCGYCDPTLSPTELPSISPVPTPSPTLIPTLTSSPTSAPPGPRGASWELAAPASVRLPAP